ncbi:MAG: sugar ABC transporter permease [Chloroflexi bacterium]|nr:sugar ABC transporter permease [Chloroflexota bacterium]
MLQERELGRTAVVGIKTSPATAVRKHSLWLRIWKNRTLYLLIAPVFFGAGLFQYYPALTALYRSFYAWDGRRAHFVGLDNFEFFLTDPRLLISWVNVSKLLIFHLIVVMTLPVLVAYLIYRLRDEGQRYRYRVLFVLPIVVPGFVNIVLWKWFYSLNGVINFLLRGVGLESWTRVWLGDPDTALYALMFMGFPWVGGITMLIYLAGFLTIPMEVLDAAIVDGATGLKRFWLVEMPFLRGQLKLQVILTFIGTIQGFQAPLIMTRGGPGYATMVPGLRMYDAAMVDFKLGYASSIGVILFIVIFTLTLINQRFIRGGQEYDEA